MRLLAAVDNELWPPVTGATQRSFGLLRGLARRHEVEALCVVPVRGGGDAEQTVAGVTLHRRRRWYTSAAWRLEQMGLAPLGLAADGHARSARSLMSAFEGGADALLADLPLAALLDHADGALRVHTSHNVEADLYDVAAPRVLARGFWKRRLAAREARAVERADVVVVCSDEDAVRMAERYGAPASRFEVAPNGWDETSLQPPSAAERAAARERLGLSPGDYAVLFLGSDWAPNRQALARLVEQVMPQLAAHAIVLVVAGDVGAPLAGRREPWLRVVGPVRDARAVSHACDAGINPVTAGGGSNVKLAGYLGAGLAAITTPFGLRGFPDLAPWCAVAPPEALADAVRARPSGWAARGEALPPAIAAYAWGAIGERLGDALEARRAPRRAAGGLA